MLSHTITSLASSVAPRSWEVRSLTSRRRLRSSITTCTSVSRLWTSAFRFRTLATFTWTFVRSYRRWASTSWPCSTPWKLSFWSRMNLSRRCLSVGLVVALRSPLKIWIHSLTRPVKFQCQDFHSSHVSPKTAWLYSASPIITSLSSRNSWNSTRPPSTRTRRQHSRPWSTWATCTQWHRIWMRCWHRPPKRSQPSSKRPWPRAKSVTRRACPWPSLNRLSKAQTSSEHLFSSRPLL